MRLGEHYIGKNADALVIDFGPPASTFKMNSGDTSYVWQLGNQTNAAGGNGAAIASTRFCKVSVVASKTGIVTLLNTEDSNAGGGCRRRRHVWQHLREPAWDAEANIKILGFERGLKAKK